MINLPYTGWMNKEGTSDRPHSESWKRIYIRHNNGNWPSKCSCRWCSAEATDGAHMYCRDAENKKEYIVPLCHKHNMSNDELTLEFNTTVVPANLQELENLEKNR